MALHLLVLIHGMWGNPSHLTEMDRIISDKYPSDLDRDVRLVTLVAQANRDKSTYDGIDWGGERIAEEILNKVEDLERDGAQKVTRFSVVGYSLGGLLARYVIGVLLTRNFFDTVHPVNFATIATPHFGLPRSGSFRQTLFARLGPVLLSRTGEHFYGIDKWSGTGQPLLEVLADKDQIFIQALSRFKTLNIYANAVNDATVPFITAAFEAEDPFKAHETNGIKIQFDERYSPLIESFELPPSPPPPPPKPSIFSIEYFRRLKPRRPYLPPALQFRFPGSFLFAILIPIVLPVIIGIIICRLGLDARASRARIKSLEQDPSRANSLINMLHSIEKGVDDAVADILDDPQQSSDLKSESHRKQKASSSSTPVPSVDRPILTPTQHRIIASLNSLPQLKKHFAFIDPVLNSHAVIVSRDVKRFELHKRGHGVLRHLADSFEL